MNRKNIIAFICLGALIVAALTVSVIKKSNADNNKPEPVSTSKQTETTSTMPSTSNNIQTEDIHSTEEVDVSLNNSLFIGDSRTVGLMEYADISGADFYCDVGMSVYNYNKKRVSVPDVGKVLLTELLSNKKYNNIYIMLGINELGYNTENTVAKYSELIDIVKKNQPDAVIFIEANLHVAKSRSDSDKIINNTAIDKFNTEIKKFADGKTVFYIDANTVFDDELGNLDSDKTSDGSHLYAKYYAEWGQWIMAQTESLARKGNAYG